jgi:hypothetical protein
VLESLLIQNFQIHKKIRVKLSPSVTTFIGRTDSGKSAIIRAFRLLVLNDFDKSFHRHGTDRIVCSLTVDGHRIKRIKGERKNTYSLDGKTFHAFGQGKVPEQIENILNIGEENFQDQDDPHFWFSDTAGQVSKKLNAIVNLEVIDSTLANLQSELRRAKSEVEITHDRLTQARKDVEELSWVRGFDTGLSRLEDWHSRIAIASDKRAILGNIIAQTGKVAGKVETGSELLLSGKKLISFSNEYRQTRKKKHDLSRLIGAITLENKIANLVIPDFKRLHAFRLEGDRAAENRRNLEYLIRETQDEETKCSHLRKSLQKEKAKIKGRCPTCGRKI